MKRDEKASIVSELSDKFSKAKIAIASDYRGLTVTEFQEVRRELKKNQAEIRVAKNTLLKRAVQGTEFEGMQGFFTGTTAVTVSYGDPVAPAKVLVAFSKDKKTFEIKGAVLDGKTISTEELIALSKLPSKEILLSQLLSVMQAVPTSFVRVLNGIPQKFVYLLQAISDQKN
ncbi:MAG: 50S ribosomal protein L10 [Proteobacteria bacterium]|nr:50S ribosomal protein L10 [Pseudomonadota bacterium]MBU1710076.1 50S ribosomal protein L10 [Pseudomonadota bacterium]